MMIFISQFLMYMIVMENEGRAKMDGNMKTYKVYLSYVKDFTVEANSYEEAIRKAHEGDVISEGSLIACPEDDYADED